MDVVGHQAEGVDTAVELFNRPLQEEIQSQSVAIIKEDRVTGVTAQDNVIDCAWIMDAGFACHAGNVSVNSRKSSLTPELPPIIDSREDLFRSLIHRKDRGEILIVHDLPPPSNHQFPEHCGVAPCTCRHSAIWISLHQICT
jgi:hypothetical protein